MGKKVSVYRMIDLALASHLVDKAKALRAEVAGNCLKLAEEFLKQCKSKGGRDD